MFSADMLCYMHICYIVITLYSPKQLFYLYSNTRCKSILTFYGIVYKGISVQRLIHGDDVTQAAGSWHESGLLIAGTSQMPIDAE